LLSVTNIVKRFGGVTALNGVDLELGPSEILGLIGPNGSGKTTLVNCISGVLAIDDGAIRLDDRSLSRVSRARRARAGIARTFQTPRLFAGLTVRENITAGLRAAGSVRGSAAREQVDSLLTRFELQRLSRQVVSSLPYGHQRRVEIARALAGKPQVLLLDEPAAGLNDGETAELKAVIEDIRRDHGCSIIVIDHDMSLIMGVSHRIQVLDEGQVIFTGDPADAFRQRQVVEAYLGTA
jgi:ABC-type branched-subunit amino acid transport system ATPase component